MKRREFMTSVGVGGAALAVGASPALARKTSKPNIVLIMADDFGYECLSCDGGAPYQTPVLDRLAAEGLRFSNCLAQPLCTPTRAKIMTGRYNYRNYTEFGLLLPEETTFAHVLKKAGYVTGISGKWQLGRDRKLPGHFGFDEYCLWWLENKGERYANVGELIRNGETLPGGKGEYGPAVVSGFVLDFITRHKDEPFFCYYPMILTHAPFVPTPDSADPDCKDIHKNFTDMVAYTDKIVGRIVGRLDELGIRDNTVVLFVGDNGTGKDITSLLNGKPYRGGKGSMTCDAGPHVPLVVNWPAGGVRGAVHDDPIDLTDVLPTLAELAGAPLPEGVTLDGQSFAPRLRGDRAYKPRPWCYVCYYGMSRRTARECARDTRYHLLGTGEMYDFIEDPQFQNPIDPDTTEPEAKASRARLQAVLDRMAPEREKEDRRLAATLALSAAESDEGKGKRKGKGKRSKAGKK